jgi:hypothetical protein
MPPRAGTTAWTESLLYAFTGHADGGSPNGALLRGANGALFGTTSAGGSGHGVIFELIRPNQ